MASATTSAAVCINPAASTSPRVAPETDDLAPLVPAGGETGPDRQAGRKSGLERQWNTPWAIHHLQKYEVAAGVEEKHRELAERFPHDLEHVCAAAKIPCLMSGGHRGTINLLETIAAPGGLQHQS
jgi:hypothetical protein